MSKPEIYSMDVIRAINGLHVSWLYFNIETRKKYKLQKQYAFYHTDMNIDFILRLEKELQKLQLSDPEDYCVKECIFGEWNIYTLCLTDKTSSLMEDLGIRITEKL